MRGLALVVLLCLALAAPRAHAQVELDGAIGPTSGLVPGGTLPDGTTATYLIEESYGRRSGPNLFHSFSRFSIPSTQSAAFTGDPAIERVIGRVTGSQPSLIDGTLRSTIEGADLYLFNPIGIVLSGTARLDLRGSLYLSSANNVRFEDGTVLPTVPTAGEVLSAAAPSAWGFTGVTSPRSVSFTRARDLQVPSGETLSIVGGPVVASGIANTPTLLAPGGTIAIASRLSPGEVPVNVADLSARDAEPGALGSINIGPKVRLDVSDPSDLAPSRGRIVIRGGSLSVTSSTLRADSAMDAAGDTRDIDIETTNTIALRSAARIGVSARGTALGGGLRLSSESIRLDGLSLADSTASGSARGGEFDLRAGSLQLSVGSKLLARATDDATAAGLSVNAATISLADQAGIGSLNASSMDANELSIVAESVDFSSGGSVVSEASGDGGGARLRIEAGRIDQASGAWIESDTRGAGSGGDIEIDADTIDLRGDAESSDPGGVFARSFGSGSSGGISIDADEVSVAGGAQVSATAEGAGRGGDIGIAASRTLELAGTSVAGPSGVFARSGLAPGTTATGAGGSIRVEARVAVLTDGAEISGQTYGSGTAGDVRVVAAGSVTLVGGELLTSSINAKAGVGNGGGIAIETSELRVNGGGQISTSALDTGSSGNIEIDAQRVYVGGPAPTGAAPAGIFAQSIPGENTGIDGGDGGDIEIRASSLVQLQNGSAISAESRGAGRAGNVRIVAPDVTVTDGAEVSTQTFGSGKAGEVSIRDARTLRIEDGEVSARSAGAGAAGSVTIDGIGALIVGERGSIATETLADGRGGSISIDANSQVLVMNGGTISALSAGTGDAGSITIDAGERFSARNGGRVTTSAVAADGGDISIAASRLIYIQDGKVTTDVRAGLGSGGNITLDPEFVVLNRAELRASATGDGGNITIQTDRFVRDASSVVDASSEFGVDGDIQTTSPTVDLTSELAQLDTTFLDASSKLAAACAARSGERGTFAVRGRARAPAPDAPLGSPGDEERATGCEAPKP